MRRKPAGPSVTVNIFSGRPNPRWLLREDEAARLLAELVSLPTAPTPAGHVLPADDGDVDPIVNRPISGYRGLDLAFPGAPGRSARFQIYERTVLETATGRLLQDRNAVSIEERLYSQAPAEVGGALGSMPLLVLKRAGSERRIVDLEGPDGQLSCEHAPAFRGHTGSWKTHSDVNNCYNYSTNVLNTDDDGLPAVPGPDDDLDFSVPQLRRALTADRLEFVGMQLPSECAPPESHYLVVVLRTHPSGDVRDFHCIRLDRTGTWSHKDGQGRVRRRDDTGRLMTDLTQAELKWSPKLVGIYIAFEKHKNEID